MRIMIKYKDIKGKIVTQKGVEILSFGTVGTEISYFLLEKDIKLKNNEVIDLEILNYR